MAETDSDSDLELIVCKVKLAGNQLRSLYPNHNPTDEQIKAITRAAGLPITGEDRKLHDDPMRIELGSGIGRTWVERRSLILRDR